jgi:SAM-dependent methyltransferase
MAQYDTLADVYEFLVPEQLLSPAGSFAAFAPWLPPPPARVLDCACGTGTLAAGLLEAGYETDARDLSPEMVARARALGVAAEVRAWEDLEPTHAYDAVLCIGNSLPHTPDRRAALAAMAGALRPGGTLLLTSRNWELEQPAGEELVERDGRRAVVTRTWTPGTPTRFEITVAIDGAPRVAETLTVWPFTHAELLADLAAAGLTPTDDTYEPTAARYLLAAST